MKIYRNRRALGVNTGVANCIKADLNVLVDTGMNWPRSLVRTNRDDARTKWYLINCALQCAFDVLFGRLFRKHIEDSSPFSVRPRQPIFQEPEDSSYLRDTIHRFVCVLGNQVAALQRLQESVM